mmetsp:Transcript_13209/g.45685  ORF Transcript_13209/g.45685 Transcript_13209/m.45685 type:complete len:488 (-) Transcript_13209:169-1632(-)|eukprot:CAMPEP_0183811304 /NCGR_PEP_ID=MMETSP0803_2-20130417/49124_1 /TAXON_ID=195967 /ORGANISM="Crustomastix stigmata, Strain CCMP3273" /LENGTH=487 /DNA_ID=CAMNT_0026056135 /DNA_START=240 /DNA_END=1703 /DNA_ORIENTATION=-
MQSNSSDTHTKNKNCFLLVWQAERSGHYTSLLKLARHLENEYQMYVCAPKSIIKYAPESFIPVEMEFPDGNTFASVASTFQTWLSLERYIFGKLSPLWTYIAASHAPDPLKTLDVVDNAMMKIKPDLVVCDASFGAGISYSFARKYDCVCVINDTLGEYHFLGLQEKWYEFSLLSPLHYVMMYMVNLICVCYYSFKFGYRSRFLWIMVSRKLAQDESECFPELVCWPGQLRQNIPFRYFDPNRGCTVSDFPMALRKDFEQRTLVLMTAYSNIMRHKVPWSRPLVWRNICKRSYPTDVCAPLNTWLNASRERIAVMTFGRQFQPSIKEFQSLKSTIIDRGIRLLIGWHGIQKEMITHDCYIASDIPQQYVLHNFAHIFVTHCGMQSIAESLVAGVPMLCFPLFADQFHNAATLEHENCAVRVQSLPAHKELNRLIENHALYHNNCVRMGRKLTTCGSENIEEHINVFFDKFRSSKLTNIQRSHKPACI